SLWPYAVNDLGFGIGHRKLAPHMCSRPVHLRTVAAEDLVPVHRFSSSNGLPVRHLVGMIEYFLHVVTGAEAQLVEGSLERHCTSTAETRTDDCQRHGSSRGVRGAYSSGRGQSNATDLRTFCSNGVSLVTIGPLPPPPPAASRRPSPARGEILWGGRRGCGT